MKTVKDQMIYDLVAQAVKFKAVKAFYKDGVKVGWKADITICDLTLAEWVDLIGAHEGYELPWAERIQKTKKSLSVEVAEEFVFPIAKDIENVVTGLWWDSNFDDEIVAKAIASLEQFAKIMELK
jgi:hypothetical protein